MTQKKLIIATTSLAGCFGCHVSLMDIDERILELVDLYEFNKSPINDIKEFTKECDVGLIEGGCSNTENVRVLREFRKHCKTLISIGACAINGGLPVFRNGIPLKDLFDEAFVKGPTVVKPMIPSDEELPVLLDRIYPCHEIVKIDHFLPGCPPRSDLLWAALKAIGTGQPLGPFEYKDFRFD